MPFTNNGAERDLRMVSAAESTGFSDGEEGDSCRCAVTSTREAGTPLLSPGARAPMASRRRCYDPPLYLYYYNIV